MLYSSIYFITYVSIHDKHVLLNACHGKMFGVLIPNAVKISYFRIFDAFVVYQVKAEYYFFFKLYRSRCILDKKRLHYSFCNT